MTAESPRYSLWVRPPAEVAAQLQAVIDKLADTYGAPRFTPHMTLVANMLTDLADVEAQKARVTALGARLGKFSISLNSYGYLDEEFRSLFLYAESQDLPRVYEQTTELFPEVATEHFAAMPHFSMLYGHFDETTKQAMISDNPLSELRFAAASIDIIASGGAPETWETVYSVQLPAA